jgi:hypothetical protein
MLPSSLLTSMYICGIHIGKISILDCSIRCVTHAMQAASLYYFPQILLVLFTPPWLPSIVCEDLHTYWTNLNFFIKFCSSLFRCSPALTPSCMFSWCKFCHIHRREYKCNASYPMGSYLVKFLPVNHEGYIWFCTLSSCCIY